MERIRLEFPKLPKDRIELFDTYLNEITFEKLKKKALVRDWAREKLNLKNLAEEQIVTQIQRQIDSIAIERKRLETVNKIYIFFNIYYYILIFYFFLNNIYIYIYFNPFHFSFFLLLLE